MIKLTKLVEAIAEDVTGIDERLDTLTTKDQIIALHTQVNSIETDIRGMKRTKLHARVVNLGKSSSAPPATNPPTLY